jgi:hypothetical protein
VSLRKTAGLLAVAGLVVGLLGSGVGAIFYDQVTGTESIDVGTFDCTIIDSSAGTFDATSATYAAPTIQSSAAGSAPFSFTVKNDGSIDQMLSVSMSGQTGNLGGHFSAIPVTPTSVLLAPGATQVISAGIQWTELVNDDLGRAGSMTWTVACNEIPPNDEMASTNANNQSKSPQWANGTWEQGEGTVTLTFHQNRNFYSCFEYRTDGDVSQRTGSTNPGPGIYDGLYPYHCLNVAGTSWSITFGPTIQYVEFRMVFGAEADERFDWTRVDAL